MTTSSRSRIARRSLFASLAAASLLAPVPAIAADGEPEVLQERGRTVGIVDGDTIKVNIWGDGTSTPSTVRFTGVNTNEVGQCHAGAATSRTSGLALRRVTHLYAIDVASHSGDRLRRTVLAKQPDGTFRNLARVLVSESRANASPIGDEWAWNREYREIQDRVTARGVRLWNNDACETGPQQAKKINVAVHWEGGAATEYVDITNNSATALSLSGWWVRNSSPSRFVFPRGAAVPAGRTLRLHVGAGTSGGLDYYWRTTERFLDVSDDQRYFGNAAFLVDPDADIRAWDVYPDVFT